MSLLYAQRGVVLFGEQYRDIQWLGYHDGTKARAFKLVTEGATGVPSRRASGAKRKRHNHADRRAV
jgi:hypothetical protein